MARRAAVREPRTGEHEVKGLARWLRACRQEAGFSQEQLADAIGASRRNYIRWESLDDPSEMGATSLLRVFDALGVKVVPPAPEEIPRSVNTELAALRERIELIAARVGLTATEEAEELLRRLESGDRPPRENLERAAASMRDAARLTAALADRLEEGARAAER